MLIGEVASRAGVSVQAVRYYERRGLLPRPARTQSGYREYDDSTIELLRFINSAQTLGFTLREISPLVSMRIRGERSEQRVREIALARLAAFDEKLREIRQMRAQLVRLMKICGCDMGGRCVALRSYTGSHAV